MRQSLWKISNFIKAILFVLNDTPGFGKHSKISRGHRLPPAFWIALTKSCKLSFSDVIKMRRHDLFFLIPLNVDFIKWIGVGVSLSKLLCPLFCINYWRKLYQNILHMQGGSPIPALANQRRRIQIAAKHGHFLCLSAKQKYGGK